MRFAVAMLAALALAGCVKPKPGPPVVIENSEVESKLYWAHDLDGRRVSVDGYVAFDNGENGQAIAMGPQLNTSAYGQGERLIRFDAERGTGPNQLNLPVLETRTMRDAPAVPAILTIDISHATYLDKAGAAHPLDQRVRVTGTLRYASWGSRGLMSDEEPRAPGGRTYKPQLTDVALEAAP